VLCEIVPALYPIGPDPEIPVTKDTGMDPELIVPSVVIDVDPAQDVRFVMSAVPIARTVFTCAAVSAAGVAVEALALPMIVFGLIASFAASSRTDGSFSSAEREFDITSFLSPSLICS
jgi:hypothetical protein